MIMLQARNLSKAFTLHLQGGTSIPVLEKTSFEMRAGECVALTGQSGAGKSTLLRSLYGSYLVDQGRILVWHRHSWADIASGDPRLVLDIRRETLGYVSQFLRVIPRVSTLEIVAETAYARGRPIEQARAEAETMLLRLCIPSRLLGLPPATFSGGEQQRINLARGLVARHPILLLDEPTASLDAENRQIVITLIKEAKARGAAVAGIFHDKETRDAVADRVCLVSPLREAA